MITQRTRLDMRPGGVLPVVHVSQYDNDAAALIFDLYDGGELFTVPTGSSVLLNGLKPDNYGFSYQAASISGNTVVCNLTTQMTAVAGAVVCELRVRNGAGTQIIGSCNFILQVEAAALTDDTIISDTMIPLIEQAVEIASNLDRYITQTQSNAEIASAAATTATNAANSAQIVDANVTGLYNSIEEAKTNANTAAANANTVAANIAAAAARGDYKGDKGDKGDSGITTPVWGMYTMYVDESTGDLWLVTNGEYGSEYWFQYDSETGLLYYCTPDYVEKTVSGELIEITDGADLGALQCKVAFSPIQSGTGDPSPTNIRPISGRTGMTVTAAGKNLFDGVFTNNNPNQIQSGEYVLPAGTYTYSQKYNGTPTWGVYIQKSNGTSLAYIYNTNKLTFTLTSPELVVIRTYYGQGITPSEVTEAQLEVGSTATPYEPYHGATYPVSWQTEAGTVYGGTLDVVSGVLTVDKGYAVYDGSEDESWNWHDGGTYKRVAIPLSDVYNPGGRVSVQSNAGTFRASGNDVGTIFASGTTLFYYPEASITSLADYKTWLASNNLQVVYPLATPQTYQLTPTEVRTLLGVNNIWSDGDTIEAFTYVSESYDEEG